MGEELETAPEQQLETVPTDKAPMTFNEDRINALIHLAERSEVLGKALDTLRAFVLKRALPGDWVKFAQEGGDAYLEMGSAGADRIAAVLGISFTGWSSEKVLGSDDYGAKFDWWYRCNVHFQGRTIEGIEGRCGSRDKFFGFSHGTWKDLKDVRETDIRTAARRNAMKEGVKVMLGIRRLPMQDAIKMGLPADVIKGHTFANKADHGGTQAAAAGAAAGSGGGSAGTMEATEVVVDVTNKTGGTPTKPWTKFFIRTMGGTVYNTFDKDFAQAAKDVKGTGQKVLISFIVNQYGSEVKSLKAAPDKPAGAPAQGTLPGTEA